jgi:hypothetical protein
MESEQFLTTINDQEPTDLWGSYLKDNNTSLRKLLPQSSTSPNPSSGNSYSSTNNRKWRILYSNPKIMSEYNEETPAIASIEVRTRNDTTTGTVPERLYSSLKYEVTQEISSHIFGTSTAVLMSKLQVVNPYNFEEEILKTNGKSIVKGTSELVPLTLNGNLSSLYSKTKVQFTDVSYHHEKKYFALKVSYFDPNNLNDAIFVQMSAPFQVFARRPRRKSLKRKSTMTSAPIPKKVKEEKISLAPPMVIKKEFKEPKHEPIMQSILSASPLNQFLSTIHTLEGLTEKLSDSEIKCGIDSIEKLLQNLREHQTCPSHEHDVLSELDFFNI